MLPRWHILSGLAFTLILWYFFPQTEWYYLAIVFLSAFLIDFDHYMCAVYKTGRISLFNAFKYHDLLKKKGLAEKKRGIRRKGDFHVFHTIEFHALVLLAGFVIHPVFFYVLVGMVFHSLLDVVDLSVNRELYRREFFFVNWAARKLRGS